MSSDSRIRRITTVEGPVFQHVEPFAAVVLRHNLKLLRGHTHTLQVNVGLLCNQTCKHCHLEAGPDRLEIMTDETLHYIVDYVQRSRFDRIDITGGAPEMNPHITGLLEEVSRRSSRVMLRSNLTALTEHDRESLIDLCRRLKVVIIASLPSTKVTQVDAQRGSGVGDKSIAALKRLNEVGYGQDQSGLELNLVANPAGAFLPVSQVEAEKRFRKDLLERWGICFNNLFTFANVPLGRFRQWLAESGNLETYVQKLASSFNPCNVDNLMCRSLVSVSWDGFLYDCDFNLALGLPLGGERVHVSETDGAPPAGMPISVSDHCYACTAGSGFT